MVDKRIILGYLYALKAMLSDPSMNAMTPVQRLDDVINKIEGIE